jgi:hypothetical protein
VKVLRSDLPWTPTTIERFKQEARAIARLSHPNTVPIHFVGEGEGLVYYAMPYLEGRTLADLLRTEGPLPADRALRVVEPILEALQHAHDNGLVHRDVKPDNILLEVGTGRPLLVDFGIVKYLDGPANLTDAGFIVGTPLYMSPEQALGSRSVDARSDVYGIGAVLFQLLTGAPPFEGADSQEIVGRHIREPVPFASLSRDGIPPWIGSLVLRCMAKHPDDRFPTARAVLEAIRAGKAGAHGATVDPALVVENRLAEPIALSMGDTALTIRPGETGRLSLRGDQPLEASWAMVQPGAGDRLLGARVEGAIVAERVEGELYRVVDAETGGEMRFAPTVVNEAGRPLTVAVVGPEDSVDCDCRIANGDSLRLGYYRYTDSTALRVTDSRGWSARLIGVGDRRDPASGAVEVRVRRADLRPPPRATPRRAESSRRTDTERRNPLSSFLPVR